MPTSDAPELQARVVQIIRTIAGTYWLAADGSIDGEPRPQTVMEMTTDMPPRVRASLVAEGSDPDSTWFVYWDVNPRDHRLQRALVHIPPTLLDEHEDVAKGSAAHEAGHLAITRKHCVVPEELLALPGFAAMLAATEERATDNVVHVRFPGAGAWLRRARQTDVAKNLAVADRVQRQQGLPRYLQLCNAITFEPYGFPTGDCSAEVQAVFASIRDDVARLEQTLPADHSTERQVREAAIERYRIAYDRIWPLVQPLVAADVRDEACKQLAQRNAGAGPGPGPGGQPAATPPGDASGQDMQEALEALPEDERHALQAQAERALAELEAALGHAQTGTLEPGAGRNVPMPGDSGPPQGSASIHRAMEELSASRTPWDATYAQVRALDAELTGRLEDIFAPSRAGHLRRRLTGARLNLRSVFRWEARRAAGATDLDNRLFETRDHPEARDHAVTILVDMSGSMSGDKIAQAFAAVVLLVEVLSRLDIAIEVLGFRDTVLPFKDFDQPLANAVRERMEAIPHSADNGNADGPCLLQASQRLGRNPAKVKILLAISDGMPSDGDDPERALRDAVAHIVSSTDQILIGIGLGPGTEHVGDFYPASLASTAAADLPRLLADILEHVIADPGQYRASHRLNP